MLLIASGLSLVGFFYYNRHYVALKSLKTFTYFEKIINEMYINDKINVVETLEYDNMVLIKYSINNKIYRTLEDKNNITSIDLQDINLSSNILAMSLTIKSKNNVLLSELDITDFINSFIINNKCINLTKNMNFIWFKIFKHYFNLNDLNYENSMEFIYNIIDNQANTLTTNTLNIKNREIEILDS